MPVANVDQLKALKFCHILNKFAAQLDDCLSFKDFCLKQNSKASYRRKLGGSAICSKYEQNFTASLSVAYLFFIIYQKSIEWTIHKIFPEASKYTACSLKVSGTVSSKEAEEIWYPASFLAGHRTAIQFNRCYLISFNFC